MNVIGVSRIVDLCRKLDRLEVPCRDLFYIIFTTVIVMTSDAVITETLYFCTSHISSGLHRGLCSTSCLVCRRMSWRKSFSVCIWTPDRMMAYWLTPVVYCRPHYSHCRFAVQFDLTVQEALLQYERISPCDGKCVVKSPVADCYYSCICFQALVHISTAYANCNRRSVDEVVYPAPLSPAKVVSAIEWVFCGCQLKCCS